jgi:hypothetical protein
MKKLTAKSGSRSSRRISAGKESRKPADLAAIRQKLTNLIGGEAATMVWSTIEEANKGHFAAMKYLFEMIGLFPASGDEQEPEDNSLAKTLLRRMGVPEEPESGTEVTKDCPAPPAGAEGDAVK